MPVHGRQRVQRRGAGGGLRVGRRCDPREVLDPPPARAKEGLHAPGALQEVTRLLAIVLTGAVAFAATPALAGTPQLTRKPQKKKVEVADNFYGPKKLTV